MTLTTGLVTQLHHCPSNRLQLKLYYHPQLKQLVKAAFVPSHAKQSSALDRWVAAQTQVPFHKNSHPHLAPLVEQHRTWLSEYFKGEKVNFEVQLEQQKKLWRRLKIFPPTPNPTVMVWERVAAIPYGNWLTYGAIAEQLKKTLGTASPRAVGSAVGKNPLCVFIPCHRVLPKSGWYSGFGGGREGKKILLNLEGIKTT